MTTKTAGGKITGLLALSYEAEVALEIGDPVMGSGDYECVLNDGTKPVIGHVSVANKEPVRGVATRPAQVPGPVTVEAIGFYVRKVVAGGVIAAGAPVGYNATGDLVAVVLGDPAECGVALVAAAQAGDKIDVLFR
jgi:hypothetical protein